MSKGSYIIEIEMGQKEKGKKENKEKGDGGKRGEKCTGVNQFGLDERRRDQSIQ